MPVAMAKEGLASLYRSVVPTNIRLLGERLLGADGPITNQDFTPEELEYIREVVARQKTANAEEEARLRDGIAALSAADLEGKSPELQQQIAAMLARNRKALASYENTRGRTSAYAYDDVPDHIGPIDTLVESFRNPGFTVGTSLGSFVAHDTPEGLRIEDTYDWGTAPEGASPFSGEHRLSLADWVGTLSDPRKMGNLLMNTLSPGADRPVELLIPTEHK